MNCKPGDLAVLVRANLPENIGSFCEVLGASGIPDYEWSVKFQSPKRLLLSGDDSFYIGDECLCPDAWLRPIRDPGDEAVDETLLWKSVPALETA
jgi:hypothetical protein